MVDPFGGVALGAMDAMGFGCRWYGCELEERFVALGNQNLELWRDRWQLRGAVLLQGDSRRLCEVLGGAIFRGGARLAGVDCVVASPPFMENNVNIGAVGDTPGMRQQIHDSRPRQDSYGQSPGQLGNMPAGSADAVISSPPYAETVKGQHGERETAEETRELRRTDDGSLGQSQRHGGYGVADGQLGAMPAGEVDAVVSSPPYEGTSVISSGVQRNESAWGTGSDLSAGKPKHCGGADGQMGETEGQTFWAAAREIVQQCHQILKPGGVAIWVTKDFVRKGQRVPFSDDWRRLCESVGFVTIEWIKASLVKETRHPGLFGDVVERKERKSFFRRLAERNGAPAIDHEDVIVVRKSVDGAGEVVGVDCVVSSPPYATDQMGGGGSKHDRVIDAIKEGYGTTCGNLANMPAGKPGEVI